MAEELRVEMLPVLKSGSLIDAAIRYLEADERQAISLRRQGHSFDQIGERIGKSAAETSLLWGRAIIRLGRLMGSPDPV